ncbi:Serine-protein kinase ATM [Oopsacas minuta]|uniref:Serine-protein kinase ATM n=1 Tax=Oopsacas minuta TaxID=111878 RepID=A0AAV7K539_9METZ|nr:Serine-protein kinase ATM [Oopsacas minuta]
MDLEDRLCTILQDLTKSKQRVKARKALEDLLTDKRKDVVGVLNNSQLFTWKELVFSVMEYNMKEIDDYLKKQVVAFSCIKPLLSTILKLQFENDNYSAIKYTIQHVTDQLTRDSDFILSFIGHEYVQILGSLIIDNYTIRCLLTQDKWNLIYKCMCALVSNSTNATYRSYLLSEASNVFLKLIDIGYQHSTLPIYYILNSLFKALCEFKDIHGSPFIKLISTFNILAERDGIECRALVCRIGDDILDSMLNYIINAKSHNNNVTEQCLVFIFLQIKFHHPSDIIEPDYITREWINSLLYFHQVLLEKFQAPKDVFQLISTVEVEASDYQNIPKLFYRMLVQVERSFLLIIEYFPDSLCLLSTSQPKRIKLSSVDFVDLITDNLPNHSHPKFIIYLHLLLNLLANMPHLFKNRILIILRLLFEIPCTRAAELNHSITNEVIHCLICIVTSKDVFLEQNVVNLIVTNILLQNLHLQKQPSYYRLLSIILESNTQAKLPVINWKELQHSLIDSKCIGFLWKYLSIHDLPCCQDIPNSTFSMEHSLPRHSTRIFIINCLLPEKFDNTKSIVNWLTSCDTFFMLGQILASQCMLSSCKSLLLTERFLTDSMLRKFQHTTKVDNFSQDSIRIMLEFEFIPIPTLPNPETFRLYKSERSAIPSYYTEYIAYINSIFLRLVTYFSGNECKQRSTILLSLLKYYFYFHFNLVVWTSFQTNLLPISIQNEFIILVFNQLVEDLLQFPSLDTLSATIKLEEFLIELKMIVSNSNYFYTPAIHSVISSFLNIIPDNIIDSLKSIISHLYESTSKQLPLTRALNPLDINLLDKQHTVTISIVRILCNLHWLYYKISSTDHHHLEYLLTNSFLCQLLNNLLDIKSVFSLQASIVVCEHLAYSFTSCSESVLCLILERLLLICTQLCKFNQTALNKVMLILQCLAEQLVCFIKVNITISHHVENLLRILTSIYMNVRFSNPNRVLYIEFIFHFYKVFHELNWPILTLQTNKFQENADKTLEELIYELNLDFNRECISSQSNLLAGLHPTSSVIESQSHFCSFNSMINSLWENNQSTYLTQNLIPVEYGDSVKSGHVRSILVFIVKMAISCSRKCSCLVAQILNFFYIQSIDSMLINKVLSNIAIGLSYPDLQVYFDSNVESIMIEWRSLNNSICNFPFELICLKELDFIEHYATKCIHIILLTSDSEAMGFLVNSLSQEKSNTHLLKFCFEHNICTILLNSTDQLPIIGLPCANTVFPQVSMIEVRSYILQQLSLELRRKLIQDNSESCLSNLFTKYIDCCSKQRKQFIESISPPLFLLDLNVSCLEDVFAKMFGISLFSLFKENPYLLPKLHIFILKKLYSSVQPHTFVFNLYTYCTFLQFVSMNLSNCTELLYFLLCDPVHVLFEFLTEGGEIGTDIQRIKSKFHDSFTHEDTCTLLHTLIMIYRSCLLCIPKLVENTISILFDILCYHSMSMVQEISTLCLECIKELFANVLFMTYHPKVIAILFFIPSNPVFEEIKIWLNKKFKNIIRYEILQELAVNAWYACMSCVTYLNQVKLNLQLSFEQTNNSYDFNSLFDDLVQKIHIVSTSSNSTEKLSELLCEIFLLLTPFCCRHRIAFECANLDVYTRPINLAAHLYHLPILLSRLSKLVKSTKIQLKEIAYTTYNSFSDPQSLLTSIAAYKQSGVYSNLPMIYSSYLLNKKISKVKFCSSKNTNTHIPFQIPLENSEYQTKIWVRKLCIFLLENYIKNPIFLNTKPLIELSDDCAKDFLKMYIYEVILGGDGDEILIISEHLNCGLKQSFDFLHDTNSSTIPIENCVNEFCIRIIMEIVQFLRRKVLFDKQCRSFRDNFLLDINYLYLACSAFFCKDYHSTLLYLHIYMDPLCSEYSSQNLVPNSSLVVPKLLINTYGELGEIECVNSVPCNSLYLEFQKVKLVGKWSEVIQMCGNFPFNQIGNSQDLNEAMYHMGWYSMLLQQSNNNSESISNLHYESAWRLSLWDEKLPDVGTVNSNEIFSQQIIYECIKAFKEKEISYTRDYICSKVSHTLREFLICSEGSIFNISYLLSNISIAQTLIQFSTFAESVLASHRQSNDFPSQSLLLPFKEKLKDILSIRVSLLLRLVNFLEAEECCDHKYFTSLFELILNDVIAAAKLARKSNHYSEANNLLHTLELKLESMEILPQKFKKKLLTQISLESAKVKFLQKDFQTCHSVLKLNINRFSKHPTQFPELYCYFLTLYGNFLGETQQETASNVVSHYLERSVNTLQQLEYDTSSPSQVKLLEKAYFSLAQFSDKQYSIIIEYLNSPDYKMKLELAEAFDKLSELSLDTTELKRTLIDNIKQAKEYRQQSCEFEMDKIEFLKKALESYCFCLELSNTHDMAISRVISLWFDNSDNHEINQMLPSHLNAISSHKFIPWVFQIIPRLCFLPCDVTTPFSLTLTDLVIRMTTDHPYHCLPILFAIFLSPLDNCFNSHYTYGSLDIIRLKLELINNDKSVFRCRNILDKVRMLQRDIVLKMENISTDLIMLAYHTTPAKNSGIKIPKQCTLLGESAIQHLPVLTIDIPISPVCNYTDVVRIVKFEPTFIYLGGKSKPKLFTCWGSDGNRYKMLLKGREDLRKDAVIQQGFSLINQLLAQDSWFVEKGVTIRTYKIVPLSQDSGLISFCEGTISLSEYLVQKNGAHQRYYPNTPTSSDCEGLMYSARKHSNQHCLTSFRKVCQIFHPVFRFFFFEMFTDSTTWFQRKMQYTRSVAVTSMAGYIFGVGDRHTENIRINTSTAEIVHIDFGELFDSGKHLPVPELVPFRLTRDLIDPMGQLGKEGVFRPCCEETLRIIRQSKENIKSVINVLLYTPLHKWKILQNCLKASMEKQSSQGQELPTNTNTVAAGNKAGISMLGEDTNEIALRVLLRINEKIDGIEGRTPLSIAGQVNRLIAEATDEVNLSLMYPGWKAWL